MADSIAIVESETPLREELVCFLKDNGFAVTALTSAEQLYKHMVAEIPKILILDTMLPGEDGLSVADYLRKYHKNIGIIFSTALGGIENRLQGIKNGADAYLTKPVDMREYLYLINRLLSRIDTVHSATNIIKNNPEKDINILCENNTSLFQEKLYQNIETHSKEKSDSWVLDMKMATLSDPNGISITLTSREYELLDLLFTNNMSVVPKPDILKASQLGIHDWHRIENRLVRLRKKVKTEMNIPFPVRSIFGKGLVFAANGKIR